MHNKQDQKALTLRSVDQAAWYTEVVQRAGLADYSPVRGCMVIKPYGYAIWERIQQELDTRIKAAGVQNAYFPLFIPYRFLEREAEHVEGFAPEVAVVTHAGGEELEEKLVVRPTSETIMYEMFKDWVQSYNDLPLLINQWANVVRWEKRTSPFLRTTEFLWQEGHTAHATREEAVTEVLRALDMYADVATSVLALDVIKGYKTDKEKFAGADFTTTIEAMMGDGKALQSGTSHLLGQNFAKSFDIQYMSKEGTREYVWQTSWGLSTRIIGAVIMAHGDDKGLVLPPNVAPTQVIVVPIYKADNQSAVLDYAQDVYQQLKDQGVRVELDNRDYSPGYKFADAELRGIPLRIEVGGRDLENKQVTLVTRYNLEKSTVAVADIANIKELLEQIQQATFAKAQQFTKSHIHTAATKTEFDQLVANEIGFISCFFSGDKDVEKQIQEQTKFTTRCIPLATYEQTGECIFTGKPGKLTLFAKAY
jgi:prolyl-tRNA synthetase